MCYHTTYLFSLCGHTVTSPQPVKHTEPCRSLTRFHQGEPDSASIQLHDSVNFTASSPSSLEFETAMEHSNLTPTSPTSQLDHEQNKRTVIAANVSALPDRPVGPSFACSTSTVAMAPILPPTCTVITRHPLHTFVLPKLCWSCYRVREQNIAFFTAETIKDSVNRSCGPKARYVVGAQCGMVDTERKRIQRHGAERGKMIPLKLLQQQSAQAQEPHGNEATRNEEQDMMGATAITDDGLVEDPGADYVSPTKPVLNIMMAPDREKTTEPPSPGHSSEVPVASAKLASVWWLWGRQSTSTTPATGVPAVASSAITKDVPAHERSHHRERSSGNSIQSPRSARSRLFPKGFNNLDVTRDILGRNAKGMNRIMEWGNEESAASGDDGKS